uniref:BHLH domain-containing protein n=1 Tax=Nelumbo nucifera TaxID=4432 RepID=A0A823A0E4_NELNU|nr:TPA_asm: hypothetical protein HUJ06_018736 [Nelumbo nucifera]
MENPAFQTPQAQFGDSGLFHDFIDDDNFEQFISLIRGENADPITAFNSNYDAELVFDHGLLVESQSCPTTLGDTFAFNSTCNSEPNSIFMPLPPFSGDVEGRDDENDGDGDDDSTAATTTTKSENKTKGDRSRTLVSEGRRRSRMKEKLYALRSLVPNITKMDKASIVGDAVLYVQELQTQANKLRAEIAELESSFKGEERYQSLIVDSPTKTKQAFAQKKHHPVCRQILKMDIFQVEERGFYVRVECNKGEGVTVALYKALESLTGFHLQSSNCATVSDQRFVLTFTINIVGECGEEMINLSSLKIWVAGAFLNQGFEYNNYVLSP